VKKGIKMGYITYNIPMKMLLELINPAEYYNIANGVKTDNRVHELKIYTKYWDDIYSGRKTFEIRKNDRDYKEDDILVFRKYDPVTDSTDKNWVLICRVTYITDLKDIGLDGYAGMSIIQLYPDETVRVSMEGL
jgi:hypothetical protein